MQQRLCLSRTNSYPVWYANYHEMNCVWYLPMLDRAHFFASFGGSPGQTQRALHMSYHSLRDPTLHNWYQARFDQTALSCRSIKQDAVILKSSGK